MCQPRESSVTLYLLQSIENINGLCTGWVLPPAEIAPFSTNKGCYEDGRTFALLPSEENLALPAVAPVLAQKRTRLGEEDGAKTVKKRRGLQ